MKIEIKYNIDFEKTKKWLEQNLESDVNFRLGSEIVKYSKEYINAGKVTTDQGGGLHPVTLKQRQKYFGVTHKKPLLMTGKLSDSLQARPEGIKGVSYAKQHRKPGGYVWDEPSKPKGYKIKDTPDVPQREFIPHYDENGQAELKGTSSRLKKIYKDYQKGLVKLLDTQIRKKL